MDQIKNLLLTFCTKYFTFIFSKTGCIFLGTGNNINIWFLFYNSYKCSIASILSDNFDYDWFSDSISQRDDIENTKRISIQIV